MLPPFLPRLPSRIVFPLSADEFEELVNDDLDDIMSFNEPIETADGAGETVRDLLVSACHSSVWHICRLLINRSPVPSPRLDP